MPLPMVHLAIAVELSRREERAEPYPSPAFLLGSIAPDAIHMRPGTDRDDKRLSHLQTPDSPDVEKAVRAFLAEHMAGDDAAFAAGYAAHILTDRLWTRSVTASFRKAVAGLDPDAIRPLYYQETDQVDFDLYHTAPWREEVWRRLARAEPPRTFELLTAGEIDRWRQRTLRWFDELKDEPGIEPQHITHAVVTDFIDEAAQLLGTRWTEWEVAEL